MWRGDGDDGGCDQLVCGFADGSVRVWDERCATASLYSLQPHDEPVLQAAYRPSSNTVLTVW